MCQGGTAIKCRDKCSVGKGRPSVLREKHGDTPLKDEIGRVYQPKGRGGGQGNETATKGEPGDGPRKGRIRRRESKLLTKEGVCHTTTAAREKGG